MCDREREEENLKITRKEKIYEMKSRVYERNSRECKLLVWRRRTKVLKVLQTFELTGETVYM